MSLLSEIESLARGGQECIVSRWEHDLDAKDAAELTAAVASSYPLSAIYQALINRHGQLPFSLNTFLRHYRGARGGTRRCGCRS